MSNSQKDHKLVFKTNYRLMQVRAILEKGGGGGGGGGVGETVGDIFFYGWLVRKVFKLYGSLVFDQI